MRVGENYFSLFGLPVRFKLDRSQLEQARRTVVSHVHPDRYANTSLAEQRVALQWSAYANQAYQHLSDPLLRARYMCELAGIDLQVESNLSMRHDFLMQQMQWRERLEAISEQEESVASLQVLSTELQEAESILESTVTEFLDQQGDYSLAIVPIREWMFIRKMRQDLRQVD